MARLKLSISEAFNILGLPYGATLKEIKSRYRELAKEWHPDSSSKPNSEQRFSQIAMAHERLVAWDRQGRPEPAKANFINLRKKAQEEEEKKRKAELRRQELIRKIKQKKEKQDREQARQYKLAAAIIMTLIFIYLGIVEAYDAYRDYKINSNPVETIATITHQEHYEVHFEFYVGEEVFYGSERVEHVRNHNRSDNGMPVLDGDSFILRYNAEDCDYHEIDFFRPSDRTIERYLDQTQLRLMVLFDDSFEALPSIEKADKSRCVARQIMEAYGFDGMASLAYSNESILENSMNNSIEYGELIQEERFSKCFEYCNVKIPKAIAGK
ncbi:J domain-containing protein [Phaeocystidibacter luteus]|uniref:DnaJ domain-containing protein n=1 Tax=Phaeocystidibacter luteus TaxID=911197 RepID=A0A6N6RIX5_9FLAO|nr:J domain-containing protein [Phaeocystidibacter luteus]KAB2814290.1 DnaJ domain-containing protein [Phaeocystidibacter luteus]